MGFHGRDVDQIIRDLVDIAITNVRQRLAKRSKTQRDQKVIIKSTIYFKYEYKLNESFLLLILYQVESRILDALIGPNASEAERQKYLEYVSINF